MLTQQGKKKFTEAKRLAVYVVIKGLENVKKAWG